MLAAILTASGLLPMAATAQTYPNRPIRVIVPFPPGGPTDIVQRAFNIPFTQALGQQVLVDNRPGANTIVGAELAAKAPPDGYTLLQGAAATMINNPLLYRKLPYDWQKSFAPISMMVINPYLLAAHPSLAVHSIKELIALAKRRPGELTYASSGIGSSGHLAGVLFDSLAGTRMVHIPYKGVSIGIVDVLSGQVPLFFTTMATVRTPLLQSKLKALGYATTKRHPNWPNIPTFAEEGLPGSEMNTWYALFAPAGTPRSIIDRLQAETVRASTLPDIVKQMNVLDLDILTTTPEELAAYIARDYERVGKAVKTAGITLD
jgi:tripartite-type tricarboxylate transporter receptor subunit TctC